MASIKTLVCDQPGHFSYGSAEMPVPEKDHALIRIKRIGICGTDLHAFEGTQPYFSYPRVLGHELAGELIAVDGAPGFQPGDKVSFIPYFNCGKCIACRTDKPNCCSSIQVFGVHIDGGMREFISIPSRFLLKTEGLDYDALALVEPLAIGAHGVRRAGVQPGEFVLVMGAGPIGMGTMECAKAAGAKVIALDFNEKRLQFCQEKLGVEAIVNAGKQDATQELLGITGNDMPTVVIDATGNLKAINNGINYLAHGGRYVLIGLQKEAFQFSHPEFHKRESTLMSSRNANRSDFEWVMSAMKSGQLNPVNYITHRVGFDEVATEFPGWLKPEAGVIKAMVSL